MSNLTRVCWLKRMRAVRGSGRRLEEIEGYLLRSIDIAFFVTISCLEVRIFLSLLRYIWAVAGCGGVGGVVTGRGERAAGLGTKC